MFFTSMKFTSMGCRSQIPMSPVFMHCLDTKVLGHDACQSINCFEGRW